MKKQISISDKINSILYSDLFILTAVLIAQFSIDIYIETNSKEIKPIFNKLSPYLLIIISFVAIHFIYSKKVNLYKEQINIKEDLLKDKSKLIWEKYHDLHIFKFNEVINKSLEEYVINTPEIVAIQIYKYKMFTNKKDVCFKINFKYGYIEESNNINAIIQDHYSIEKKVFDRIKNILKSNDIEKYNQFIRALTRHLNGKQFKNFSEYDCTKYYVAEYLIQRLLKLQGINKIIFQILSDPKKEEDVKKMKRMGIFKGILNKEFYYFTNLKKTKKNRGYLTKCVTINNIPHIVLFTFHSDINLSQEKLSIIGENYINELDKISKIGE